MSKAKADAQNPFGEIRHAKRRAFLRAYSRTHSLVRASEAAKCDRDMHYHWLKTIPEYPEQFETAKAMAGDFLEAEAIRRATEGVEEAVWHQGVQVGTQRRYSDTLLIFTLKGANPQKYRENVRTEISGPDGKPVQIEGGASEAILAALERIAARKGSE